MIGGIVFLVTAVALAVVLALVLKKNNGGGDGPDGPHPFELGIGSLETTNSNHRMTGLDIDIKT